MAGPGDCLGYAREVGSARFACSTADGQARWAPLALLAPPLPRWTFCERQKQKCEGGLTHSLTDIYFRFWGCLPTYVQSPGFNQKKLNAAFFFKSLTQTVGAEIGVVWCGVGQVVGVIPV